MFLVFVVHFALEYAGTGHADRVPRALIFVTRLATPTFMLLSGMMLGLLRARDDFAATRDKLVDRGLFLLLVCHPLIALAHLPKDLAEGRPAGLFSGNEVFVTDTIGASLVLGALLPALSARARSLLGGALLLTSWIVQVHGTPLGTASGVLEEALFGRIGDQVLGYSFPLVPWFGVYLLGSAYGTVLARARAEGDVDLAGPTRLAFRVSAGLLCVVFLAKVAQMYLRTHELSRAVGSKERLLDLLSVGVKVPPSAGYLFFYGGIALAAVSALLRAERRGAPAFVAAARLRGALATMGRNSLILFVAQFFVYFAAVRTLPRPPGWLAPVYGAATIALLYALARFADARRLNTWFTVGYAGYVRWVRGAFVRLRSPSP
jgi:uncharacterized membrane protein